MPHHPQKLLFTPGWRKVWLREITGADEMRLAGTGVSDSLALLEHLLVKGMPEGAEVTHLTSPDKDRLLATVYQQTYGDRIKGSLECVACGEPYDLDFSLSAFVQHAHEQALSNSAEPDGHVSIGDGKQVRIPTGEDELALEGLPAGEAGTALVQRCLQGKVDEQTLALAENALAEHAPTLHTEMAAQCPECGNPATIQFDVQSYLLQSLLNDQETLSWEIHRLAKAYGWSLQEILGLPRNMRRQYARMIEMELAYT